MAKQITTFIKEDRPMRIVSEGKSGKQGIIDTGERVSGEALLELLLEGRQSLDDLCLKLGLELAQLLMRVEQKSLVGEFYTRGSRYERAGSDPGGIVLNGARRRVKRLRVKDKEGGKSVPLQSYREMQREGYLDERALSLMLKGLSSRNYQETMIDELDRFGVSKSSVDRKFIRASGKLLESLRSRRFDDKKWFVIMIDGDEYKGVRVILVMGIDTSGEKHVLGIAAGATENARVVGDLLDDLIERGLNVDPLEVLFILDGSKALRAAIEKRWGKKVFIARCRQHKIRNIQSYLPKRYHAEIRRMVTRALDLIGYADAREELIKVRRWLQNLNPDAASSLDEAFEELLTLHRLEIPHTLRTNLKSTNLIESIFAQSSYFTRNVKRWQNTDQVLRWAAASLIEAEKSFRRINGYNEIQATIIKMNPAKSGIDIKSRVA